MSEELNREYLSAIGAVVAARQRRDAVLAEQGPKSWAAEQAQEYLEREIKHRNEVRVRYDATALGRET